MGLFSLFSTCCPCLTMQKEGKSQHCYRSYLTAQVENQWDPLTERGAFSVKAKYVKPNDLEFLLKVECCDAKEQPFRRLEITSQFLVCEVPVYMVVLVFWGVFQKFLQ